MPAIVPLIVVFLAAIAAAFSTLAEGLSAANDVLGSGDSSHGDPLVPLTPGVILPVPFPGQTSEAFAALFPAEHPCDVSVGLKFDPWRVVEVPGGTKIGGWIPAGAAFTLPS